MVVYLHSGGWVSGDRSEGARHLEPLVAGGRFAGVSAGYRLADEAIWPAQIHDVKAAIRWVRANADRYGLDRDRIAVWGRSAGGHLALMAGLTGDDPAFDGGLGPHAGTSTAVAAVVNHHGITELLAIEGQPVDRGRIGPRSFEARLIGGPLHQHRARAREASPVLHASPGDPPVLTLHGTRDRTVPYDQALRLDRALKRAGVPHTLDTIPGGGHDALPGDAERRVGRFLVEILDPGVPMPRR